MVVPLMPAVEYVAYVIKCAGQFCRFGSYRSVAFVTNPLGATLYMRKRDADRRAEENHWHNHTEILDSQFSVEQISVFTDSVRG